jgi:hypothetical protein
VATILDHPHTSRLGSTDLLPTRTLTNEVHNGDGAYAFHDDYIPVDMAALIQHVAETAPSVATTPVSVTGEKSEDVDAYVLTDRASLLAVVVNNSASVRTVDFEGAHQLTADPESWSCTDGITQEFLSETSSCSITLDPWGTRLVWVHPTADRADVDQTVAAALRAVRDWGREGFDVEAIRHIADVLQSNEDIHPAKRFSLAQAIGRTVAVKAVVKVDDDGVLAVSADAVNS